MLYKVMTGSPSLGAQMNGDYIELAKTKSDVDVVDALTTVLDPLTTGWTQSGLLVLELDAESFVYVDFQPGGPWATRLAIGNFDDDDAVRRATAKMIYDKLVAFTAWTMQWTSDTSGAVVTTADPDSRTSPLDSRVADFVPAPNSHLTGR
jgi:hypothetical protein